MRLRSLSLPLLLLTLGTWWLWPDNGESSQRNEQELAGVDEHTLLNRIWIDRIPLRERDKVKVFAMLDEPRLGVFSTSSAFEGDWTTFEWSMEGGLRFHMMQSDKTDKVDATILSGKKCAPFDYCLRIKGSAHAAKQYGSMAEWVIDDAELDSGKMLKQLFFQ